MKCILLTYRMFCKHSLRLIYIFFLEIACKCAIFCPQMYLCANFSPQMATCICVGLGSFQYTCSVYRNTILTKSVNYRYFWDSDNQKKINQHDNIQSVFAALRQRVHISTWCRQWQHTLRDSTLWYLWSRFMLHCFI